MGKEEEGNVTRGWRRGSTRKKERTVRRTSSRMYTLMQHYEGLPYTCAQYLHSLSVFPESAIPSYVTFYSQREQIKAKEKKKEERGKKDTNSTPFADAKVSFTIGRNKNKLTN